MALRAIDIELIIHEIKPDWIFCTLLLTLIIFLSILVSDELFKAPEENKLIQSQYKRNYYKRSIFVRRNK